MTSTTAILNRALTKLGAKLITDIELDQSPRAKTLAANYEILRNAELSRHFWKFAKKRVILSPLASVPAFGWDYAFELPADYIRMFRIRTGGDQSTIFEDYEVEDNKILCSASNVLYLQYISEVTDPAKFHALFVEALASRIAYEMCEDITQSNSKKEIAWQDYKVSIAEAKRVDAIEERPRNLVESDWITVRG